MSSPTLLVVDDEPFFRQRLARALRERGYDVSEAANAEEAAELAQQEPPELAVVDLRMPGRSGLELVRELKTLDATTKVVVLTGYGSIATAIEAMRLGATHYLPKPADAEDVIAAFERPPGGGAPTLPPDAPTPTLARAEWEHIQRVLDDCGGNVSLAAKRLGIHRRSLQRKLQKYPPAQ